jgi:hypothetical protein
MPRPDLLGPPLRTLFRFGHVVRGIIYVLPGILALRLAIGPHGAAIAPSGAIALIGHQVYGRILLLLVAVGLFGYALWGLVRAVFDPLHRGNSPAGILSRLGFCVSALAHGGLLIVTLRYLGGAVPRSTTSQSWIAFLLAHRYGSWLIGLIGVGWIVGAGLAQIASGWRGRFERDLELDRTGPSERRWVIRLGRVGVVARGVVFTIIGIFLVATAFHANPHDAQGIDGALLGLLRQPYGRWLLAVAALGIIAFGLFSVMCARWMRIRVAAAGPLPHSPRTAPA